jgi:hypothetical protein
MGMWVDLLHGLRGLRRSLVFTTAAVLSLALGIGANTAIFSLAVVVLCSLPVSDPERLVALHGSYSGPGENSSSWTTNSASVFPLAAQGLWRHWEVPTISEAFGGIDQLSDCHLVVSILQLVQQLADR